MNNVEKVIAVAKAEVGYLEKKTNSQLDSKTANAGSANYTKYARDLDNIKGYFNSAKNGYAWCAVFVNWCFVKAYGAAAAKSLLCQPATNSYAAGCIQAVKYFKNKNQFYKTPKVGDQIFFYDSVGDAAHTGLVYKVGGSRVYTIEGNTSSASGVVANGGSVAYKSYPLNYSNAGLIGSADTIINNNGGVVITGAATTKYSATISKNRISAGSEVYANTSKTFSSLPSGSIQFTATDSRGYSNTTTANRTVIQYVKPTISIGKPTITTGGVATFKIKGNWFNGSFGATNNTLTVQYAYGAADEEYSVWQNAVATKSGNTFSVNITVSNLDYTKRYKFKTRVIDKLNTIYSIEASAQAIPIFDWGENDFKVNGDFRVTGTTTLDGNLTGKYLTGTWLQTTAATDLNSTPSKVAVLDNSGWIYSRTPNELKSDMGLSNMFISQTLSPKEWSLSANSSRGGEIKGTFKGYEGYTPILTSCYCVNSYYVAIINSWLSGSYSSSSNGYTWHIDARNFASSNITADFSIKILWIKTNLFE